MFVANLNTKQVADNVLQSTTLQCTKISTRFLSKILYNMVLTLLYTVDLEVWSKNINLYTYITHTRLLHAYIP